MGTTVELTRNASGTHPVRATSELRIDAPHLVSVVPEFALGPVTARSVNAARDVSVAPVAPERVPDVPPEIPLRKSHERLERQASELGAQLERRCRDLDQRESQLNTRSVKFEQELRAARLWISEKESELAEREERLDAEARALSQVAARKADVPQKPLSSDRVTRDAELEKRTEELKKVEASLREAHTQLEACRAQIIEKRAEFDQQVAQQREALEQYHREMESQLDARREHLDRQARANERVRAVLDRCREEIEQKHRESLRLRLATEELWVQMADGVPTTAMLQSLAKIRSRLAEEYRTAEARIQGSVKCEV